MPSSSLQPFRIQVPEEVLVDLHSRLAIAQWPAPAPGKPWERGTRCHALLGQPTWREDAALVLRWLGTLANSH